MIFYATVTSWVFFYFCSGALIFEILLLTLSYGLVDADVILICLQSQDLKTTFEEKDETSTHAKDSPCMRNTTHPQIYCSLLLNGH